MRSSTVMTGSLPVLAAGAGVRRGWAWALRAASVGMGAPLSGRAVIGVAVRRRPASSALIGLLSGTARPAYGELRVLGEDLTAARRGRSRRLHPRSQPGHPVIATGTDPGLLYLACDEVLTLSDGILVPS